MLTDLWLQITSQNKEFFVYCKHIPYATSLYSVYEGILLYDKKDDRLNSKYQTKLEKYYFYAIVVIWKHIIKYTIYLFMPELSWIRVMLPNKEL